MQIYSDEFDGKSWIWRMVSEGDTMEWQYVQLSRRQILMGICVTTC